MRFIVDRIEEGMGIIEGEEMMLQIPVALLPPGVKEGDCLKINIELDDQAGADRKKQIEEKASRLWE